MAPGAAPPLPAPPVAQVGERLAAARVARRLTLDQVEQETRIRARYLAALEADEYELLPEPAYARAFLRSYAGYLGLDVAEALDAYTRAHGRAAPAVAPAAAVARGRSARRAGRWVLAAVLLAVAAAAALTAVARPDQKRRTAESRATARTGAASSASGAARGAVLGAVVSVPRARTAAPVRPRPEKRPVARPKPRPAQAPHLPTSAVVAAVSGDCWLDVRVGSSDGKQIWAGTVSTGDIQRFGLARPLWIEIGAPGNVRLTLGAHTYRVPAGSFHVVVSARGIRAAAA